jgi:hypothetical protein
LRQAVDIDALLLVTFLALVVMIGIVLLLMRTTLAWVARWAARRAEVQFRDIERIANAGHPPEQWLLPYRQKIEKLRQRGANTATIERQGLKAQQHCLRRLDQLILFMKDGSFYDSPESKITVLETMQERRDQWAAQSWQTFMQSPAQK